MTEFDELGSGAGGGTYSAFAQGNQAINIDEILDNPVSAKKALLFIRDLVTPKLGSQEEYESHLQMVCEKHNIYPKARLDINLLYYRFVADGVLSERNRLFEIFSLALIPKKITDMEDQTGPGKKKSDHSHDHDDEKEQDLGGTEEEVDFVKQLAGTEFTYTTPAEYNRAFVSVRRTTGLQVKKEHMQVIYSRLMQRGEIERNTQFEQFAVRKMVRSASGVMVITVMTSPYPDTEDGQKGRFDCAYDCAYCPSEPGMSRSYLSTEPAVRRALQNHWNCVQQFADRCKMLADCGHVLDKLEVLVLGGTWSSYPLQYRNNFARDIYYSANTRPWRPKGEREEREPLELEEERTINETAACRVIGLTVETRPDCINKFELRHLRDCGCTRIQLGVQHTHDDVLDTINRRCSHHHAVRAIKMIKDAGFKVDIHLMPDLPGSTVEKDIDMFREVLEGEDMQADQWKIYPCSVVRYTLIEKWYREGTYVPYTDAEGGKKLLDLLVAVKSRVHPWIRLNRVIRDLPEYNIIGGNKDSRMREAIIQRLQELGTPCQCIRCREVKDADDPTIGEAELVVREYTASGGKEFFISFESKPHNGPEPQAKKPKKNKNKTVTDTSALSSPTMTTPTIQTSSASSSSSPTSSSSPSPSPLSLMLLAAFIVACLAITISIRTSNKIIIPTLALLLSVYYCQSRRNKEKDRNGGKEEVKPDCYHYVCDKKCFPDDHSLSSSSSLELSTLSSIPPCSNQPKRRRIYAFLRLRVNGDPTVNIFPELRSCGLIRELHVYGRLIAVADKTKYPSRAQHLGFGRRLIEKAQQLTEQSGLTKMAVISGDGVKEYYRKWGFGNEGRYLTKSW